MKALSTTILIVVTAVVILVAALVMLTIFGGGIGNVSTLTNFESQCRIQCSTTCTIGGLPPTWTVKQNVGGQQKSCEDVVGNSCTACGVTTTNPTNTPICSQISDAATCSRTSGCSPCPAGSYYQCVQIGTSCNKPAI